ncbi:vancomycin high temperature exclusion protein [Testudinibacter sp. TR-2022]|uniref:SanA/YdcF family protein n=1 Tax=Testudinibacter sp. TR-2022 TaxID=2585029 RepID=UPI0011180EB6|nr:ElyC/SanA/YdcF family protein [Testudinibacter sp. TR-2022]TNH03701.1 vancomycin high temperature exclusion protein [Pasteurellaceae bacterium Phil31]TNH08073.1 vancomycin high temperature exclusion protein [Testudinibacter sp. TR-2022]TNH10285.1 vancomycin high temperature exclusion protein [Testudinibacter sp. TR-2022]TNH12170.1 vancomycin high temperature exclusion protein [Testudinibacter sp. TR-2022]TNH16119.1 vancomycin high temperature exclusion protein [Testudinibacter sp. TR-2022]
MGICRFLSPVLKYVAFFLSFFAILVLLTDQLIGFYVRKNIYDDINAVPHRPYALVLGTSRYFSDNSLNLFYYNRLLAAQQLIKNNKVDYLLLSGDNRTPQYNEPRNMFYDLRKLGVNSEFMYLDFAGFRTLDSVIRAKTIFHANSITIVSQKFHCERALFIAQYYNIDAICYVAEYPSGHYSVRVREFFARLYMIWDLLTEKGPYFLGESEPLPPPLMLEG